MVREHAIRGLRRRRVRAQRHRHRFRSILLTSLTAFFGLAPLLWNQSFDAAFMRDGRAILDPPRTKETVDPARTDNTHERSGAPDQVTQSAIVGTGAPQRERPWRLRDPNGCSGRGCHPEHRLVVMA